MKIAEMAVKSVTETHATMEVFMLLQRENIHVEQGLLPAGIDAMVVTALNQKYIYINNALNLEEQRAVAAKGLGHHLMNPGIPVSFTSTYQATPENALYEKQAEKFATLLLKVDASKMKECYTLAR